MPRALLSGLIRNYQRVESMGAVKGVPSNFWSLGLREEVRLAALLRSLGLEARYPRFRQHLARLLPGLRDLHGEGGWLAVAVEAGGLKQLGLVAEVVNSAREVLAPGGRPFLTGEGPGIAAAMMDMGQTRIARGGGRGAPRPAEHPADRLREGPDPLSQLVLPELLPACHRSLHPLSDHAPAQAGAARSGRDRPGPVFLIGPAWDDALTMESRATDEIVKRGPVLSGPQVPPSCPRRTWS